MGERPIEPRLTNPSTLQLFAFRPIRFVLEKEPHRSEGDEPQQAHATERRGAGPSLTLIKADGRDFVIDPGEFEIERDSSTRIWESYSNPKSTRRELEMVRAVANAAVRRRKRARPIRCQPASGVGW